MPYTLKQIGCRPWTLNGLSVRLSKVPGPRPRHFVSRQQDLSDGFDAKFMNSGHSGWKAIGHPVRMHTP
jgi:hypothetical protein